ncbi:hypothetical protein, partial [Polaromonas sp.]|uniref:hypothetical protein n=1 Tax=Polaromonas sp. TaxID=1869339 RepID=UPI0025D14A37
ETEPTYAKRISPSKLDPYAEKLATWLGIEATKSRKQRRNLKQIYTARSTCLHKTLMIENIGISLRLRNSTRSTLQ